MRSNRFLWLGVLISLLYSIFYKTPTIDLQVHESYFVLATAHFFGFFMLSLAFRALLHRFSKSLDLNDYIVKGPVYLSFISAICIMSWAVFIGTVKSDFWSSGGMLLFILLAIFIYFFIQLIFLFHLLQMGVLKK